MAYNSAEINTSNIQIKTMSQLCPCHSTKPYKTCCQPFHKGKKPPTPVALMRSRYAAYSIGKVGYIIKTMHPNSPLYREDVVAWRKQLHWFCEQTNFAGLSITDEQQLSDTEATVTFNAILLQPAKDASFVECSLFEKVKGQWLYIKPLEHGK